MIIAIRPGSRAAELVANAKARIEAAQPATQAQPRTHHGLTPDLPTPARRPIIRRNAAA